MILSPFLVVFTFFAKKWIFDHSDFMCKEVETMLTVVRSGFMLAETVQLTRQTFNWLNFDSIQQSPSTTKDACKVDSFCLGCEVYPFYG